jgi:flagellar biosynthetic protein FliP
MFKHPMMIRSVAWGLVLLLLLSLTTASVQAQTAPAEATTPSTQADPAQPASPGLSSGSLLGALPKIGLQQDEEEYALPIQLLLLLTILTLAPAIIILMTSFTRLVVIFSILRTALGLQQSPPTQVITGLSLFLTLFIMYPVLNEINEEALSPYMAGEMTQQAALDRAVEPAKGFMLDQTREKDLMLFMDMAGVESFSDAKDVPFHVLVPAFVISELRIAFQIGFMLFLPFLIVDLIVASVLMSMGMMMLPPVMISLPIKLLLFVLTDGWYLIVESVVRGYLGT